MKQKDLISVIVPCYNVEEYVEECIKSILNQTYSNLEIILVDDKSTDKTLDVISSFDDMRVKVVKNKENIGLGPTRDKGVSVSKGEYLLFIDSDDLYSNNKVIFKMHKKISPDKYDYVRFGFNNMINGKIVKKKLRSYKLRHFFTKTENSHWSACTRIYNAAWFKKQPKFELRYAEDLYFSVRTQAKHKISRIKILNYRKRTDSLSNFSVISDDKLLDCTTITNYIIKNEKTKYYWWIMKMYSNHPKFRNDYLKKFLDDNHHKFGLFGKIMARRFNFNTLIRDQKKS